MICDKQLESFFPGSSIIDYHICDFADQFEDSAVHIWYIKAKYLKVATLPAFHESLVEALEEMGVRP